MAISEVSAAAAAAPAPPTPPAQGIDKLANKETFLQLLVAQIRNQNPLNPADGTQFLSQLAQFSELEQMLQMRQDLDSIRGALEPPAAATEPSTSGGN